MGAGFLFDPRMNSTPSPAPTKFDSAVCAFCLVPFTDNEVPTLIGTPDGRAPRFHRDCVTPSGASAIRNLQIRHGYAAPIGPRPATIVETVAQFVTRYVVLPGYDESMLTSLYAIHTHAFEVAYATPYIYVTSAEPECGKSRLLEVLEYVCRNATMVAQISASTLFRQLGSDIARPTMLIDEVDALFTGSKNEELRGILNSGYQHKGHVWRTLPGKDKRSQVIDLESGEMTGEAGSDVVKFPTFCPKILAGIDNGQLPPTLASRSITINLRRKRPDQDVARFLPRKVEPQAELLQDAISAWVKTNLDAIGDYEPEFLEGVSDRQFQIIEPLLQIAHAAGIENEARDSLSRLLARPPVTLTQGQQVLQAAATYFQASGMDRITTSRLENATGYNGKLISELLRKYDVKSMTLNKGHAAVGDKNAKGYYRRDLQEAIASYLPSADEDADS